MTSKKIIVICLFFMFDTVVESCPSSNMDPNEVIKEVPEVPKYSNDGFRHDPGFNQGFNNGNKRILRLFEKLTFYLASIVFVF